MDFIFDNFDIIFTIMLIFALLMFVFVFSMIFSPKLRSKFMNRQIKATKYMIEESQDDLAELATLGSNIAIKSKKKVMDENGEVLESLATKSASVNQKGVEITARAIKKGLTKNEKIHCKYCGKSIDDDSEFCKHCGKSVK